MDENELRWRERTSVDPLVCHGKPCIRGTRVMASVVLDNIAAGEAVASIAQAYHVDAEDVRACMAYAAALAKGSFLPITPEVA